jgi:DnaD/phage-associated family protein
MIYQDMFEDDYIGMRDRDMRLMWIGLIVAVADDQGRLLDNASLIRAKVFVYDNDISTELINDWLAELADDGKIVRYVAGYKQLIQTHKWWDYQSPSWASASKYLPPPDWDDRIKVHTVGNKIKVVNWDKHGGLCSPLPKQLHSAIDEIKSESEIKSEIKSEVATAPNVFAVYESEIGFITSHISEMLKSDIDDYSEAWVIDAIKLASENNARTMAYIEAILKRWKVEGKDSGKKQTQYKKKGNQKDMTPEERSEKIKKSWESVAVHND